MTLSSDSRMTTSRDPSRHKRGALKCGSFDGDPERLI
jgi:hypothetical protein